MIKIPTSPRLGVIRPGQRKPYCRGTSAQLDQRVGFVARMMKAGATKTAIHRAVRQRFNIEWRQCDRYISWLARTRAESVQNGIAELSARLAKAYDASGK